MDILKCYSISVGKHIVAVTDNIKDAKGIMKQILDENMAEVLFWSVEDNLDTRVSELINAGKFFEKEDLEKLTIDGGIFYGEFSIGCHQFIKGE